MAELTTKYLFVIGIQATGFGSFARAWQLIVSFERPPCVKVISAHETGVTPAEAQLWHRVATRAEREGNLPLTPQGTGSAQLHLS